jgi:hypothetical protein
MSPSSYVRVLTHGNNGASMQNVDRFNNTLSHVTTL